MRKSNFFIMCLLAVPLMLCECDLLDTIEARHLAREGNERYALSDYKGAIEKYKKALALDPHTPNLHLNLGYSYFTIYNPHSEDPMEKEAASHAVSHFTSVLKANPEDTATADFRTEILLKAAPHDPSLADQALSLFLEMRKTDPTNRRFRQYLITFFIDTKNYEKAIDYFEKELEQHPHDTETMKILAIIADKSGKFQEAVDWYFERAKVATKREEKALLYHEVGTYAWSVLYHQPKALDRIEAIKLADQGIEGCRLAMDLKKGYGDAMIYANLLYLERVKRESDELARSWDSQHAFILREQAKRSRKTKKNLNETKGKADPSTAAQQSDHPKQPTVP